MGQPKKKICKNCGRPFIPHEKGEVYCSVLCRTTGCFVGGGGDTTKPMTVEQRKAAERAEKKTSFNKKDAKLANVCGGREKFPRVVQMFELPIDQRWALAKTFTPEEQAFSVRMQKKLLMDEQSIDAMVDWDSGLVDEMESSVYKDIKGGRVGDSDDGTV